MSVCDMGVQSRYGVIDIPVWQLLNAELKDMRGGSKRTRPTNDATVQRVPIG